MMNAVKNLHQESRLLTPYRIAELTAAFQASWSKETCYPRLRDAWSGERKSLGQCAVTALIIQELYGGIFANDKDLNHVWNILPDGSEHDFTRMQFMSGVKLKVTITQTREQVLFHPKAEEAETSWRYRLLKERVFKVLQI